MKTFNLRTQIFMIEKQIPASTFIAAPVSVSIPIIPGVLVGIYTACDAALGNVYYQIRSRSGVILYPGSSGAPIASGMVSGWASGVDQSIGDLAVIIPDDFITVDMVNYAAVDARFFVQLSAAVRSMADLFQSIESELIQIRGVFETWKP